MPLQVTYTGVNLEPFKTRAREGVDAGTRIARQCAVRANLIGCLLRLDAKSSFHYVSVSQHKRCWALVQACTASDTETELLVLLGLGSV